MAPSLQLDPAGLPVIRLPHLKSRVSTYCDLEPNRITDGLPLGLAPSAFPYALTPNFHPSSANAHPLPDAYTILAPQQLAFPRL